MSDPSSSGIGKHGGEKRDDPQQPSGQHQVHPSAVGVATPEEGRPLKLARLHGDVDQLSDEEARSIFMGSAEDEENALRFVRGPDPIQTTQHPHQQTQQQLPQMDIHKAMLFPRHPQQQHLISSGTTAEEQQHLHEKQLVDHFTSEIFGNTSFPNYPMPSMISHSNPPPLQHQNEVIPNKKFINDLNISTTIEIKNYKILLLSINLFKIALGPRANINPSLSKPSFSSSQPQFFVCGTEEQDPFKKNHNQLIFSYIDDSSVTVRFTYPVPDHVRDIQWVDSQHILLAINQKLGIARIIPQDFTLDEIVMFPEFHKDAIREICVSTGNRNLVISGGFDGNVFVTDVSRLCSDIQSNQKKSENSLYPCRDVVGSVNWHPEDTYLASCTTDNGLMHIFDIRTDKRRPAIVYDTAKRELYCHSYRDRNTMFLGFGDGEIQLFDIRTKRTIMSFRDPYQKQIGEIRFDWPTKSFACFGNPEATIWNYSDSAITLNSHHQMSPELPVNTPYYKTSGEFRKGMASYGITDSYGTFALYAV